MPDPPAQQPQHNTNTTTPEQPEPLPTSPPAPLDMPANAVTPEEDTEDAAIILDLQQRLLDLMDGVEMDADDGEDGEALQQAVQVPLNRAGAQQQQQNVTDTTPDQLDHFPPFLSPHSSPPSSPSASSSGPPSVSGFASLAPSPSPSPPFSPSSSSSLASSSPSSPFSAVAAGTDILEDKDFLWTLPGLVLGLALICYEVFPWFLPGITLALALFCLEEFKSMHHILAALLAVFGF